MLIGNDNTKGNDNNSNNVNQEIIVKNDEVIAIEFASNINDIHKFKKGELKINLIGGSILNNEKTKIDLYHRSTIEKILVKKGGSLSSKYPFKQEKLIIEAKTNGNISLELFDEKLKKYARAETL